MFENMELSKSDEYFISIAKQDIHSFIMLGVMVNGKPKLLARVGKTNDLDPDVKAQATMIAKGLTTGTLARLADEGIYRREGHRVTISYQAYSINYQQLNDFLALLALMEKEQLKKEAIKSHVGKEKLIKCYAPVIDGRDKDKVIFEYTNLQDCNLTTTKSNEKTEKIIRKAQEIHIKNTCRTTAKKLIETILGFKTDISGHFLTELKYQTELLAGQPEQNSFYIIPPPPDAYTSQITDTQHRILSKLYKRLEDLPKKAANSTETRAKFDALKGMYNGIAKQNKMSAGEFLRCITDYEKKHEEVLFSKRSPHFLSKKLSFLTTTERTLCDIKTELKALVSREEKLCPIIRSQEAREKKDTVITEVDVTPTTKKCEQIPLKTYDELHMELKSIKVSIAQLKNIKGEKDRAHYKKIMDFKEKLYVLGKEIQTLEQGMRKKKHRERHGGVKPKN